MSPVLKRRLDAADQVFFLRELEYIDARVFSKQYAQLKARTLVPTKDNFAPGSVILTTRTWDQVGEAEFISDRSKRPPRVDVLNSEGSEKVRILSDGYGYTVIELLAAAQARANGATDVALDQKRADAAKEVIERKLDKVAAIGDSLVGITGLANSPHVTVDTAANGAGTHADWERKTPAEVLADLNSIPARIEADSNSIEVADTIALPPSLYTLAKQTPRSDTSETTVLDYWLNANTMIKNATSWWHLEHAGAGGARRIVAYRRDPDFVELRNPCGFSSTPPQMSGLEWEVFNYMTTAGVTFHRPGSARYFDVPQTA